jgi:hypothetical protein
MDRHAPSRGDDPMSMKAEAQALVLLIMGSDNRALYEAFKRKSKPKFSGR